MKMRDRLEAKPESPPKGITTKEKKLFEFDKKFKVHPLRYLFQCALATACIIVILVALDLITQTAIIATLGASTFIIFVRPHSYASRTRVLLGGYVIGIGIGIGMGLLANLSVMEAVFFTHKVQFIFFCAAAVGIAIPAMALTNTEHPPAAAMALGLVLNEWNVVIVLFIICCVLLLGVVKKGFSPVMINLM
jgi:CBS-domain-containing membrane protein